MVEEKQTTLSDDPPPEPQADETYHAKIVRLCHSEGLPKLAMGYSMKILVEGGIIAGTLAVLVLFPLMTAAWRGAGPITYFWAITAWGGLSGSIYAASFCLLENVTDPEVMFGSRNEGAD